MWSRRVATACLLESVRGAITTEEYRRIQELGCMRLLNAAAAGETAHQREELAILTQELGLIKECVAVFCFEPGRVAGILARLHARLEAVGADDPVQQEEQMVLVR